MPCQGDGPRRARGTSSEGPDRDGLAPRPDGLPGALALGVLLGLVATPRATPALAVVVSLAAAHRTALFGALLLFVYAVGHGLAAIVIGPAAGSLGAMYRLAPYGRALQIVGGRLIIGVGLYLTFSA